MIALAGPYDALIGLALIAFAIWLASRLLLRFIAGSMVKSMFANTPRIQPTAFVAQLRKNFFNNPLVVMSQVWSDGRNGYVHTMWQEAGRVESRERRTFDHSTDEPTVHRMHLEDGRPIAVIQMPLPKRKGEPLLIGLVLPGDAHFREDLLAARAAAEIFVLNEGGVGNAQRTSDLIGWRADQRELTYNIGAPRDVEGFVYAVGEKLKELGR